MRGAGTRAPAAPRLFSNRSVPRGVEAAAGAAAEAAAEAAAALEELQLVEQAAALTLTMDNAASQLQHLQAQLGVVPAPPPAPQPEAEESLCVVCMDAPPRCVVLPCMHMCTCEACTQQLVEQGAQSCPVCRAPIERIERVFTS